jgi:exopolysaccharide biosynthesis protein
MKTIVKNLITEEKTTYINNLSLTDNIINQIIAETKQGSNLLNPVTRQVIKEKYYIRETVSQVTGLKFAYCESLNLFAKTID